MGHLWVLDLIDPAWPTVVGELSTTIPVEGARGLRKIALDSTGTLAVVAAGPDGIVVVSTANPASPAIIGTYDASGTAYSVDLNESGTLAYVAYGTTGLQILSLSNPSNPTRVGGLIIPGGILQAVDVQGEIAYLGNRQGYLEIVDVSNPSTPIKIQGLLMAGMVYHVAVEGTVAAVHGLNPISADFLQIVDISNPANPVITSTTEVGPPDVVKGLALANGLAVVAASIEGLKTYDISVPSTPVLYNTVYTVGDTSGVVINSSYAYVTDAPAVVSIINLSSTP
jgi:hypothetical protein